MVVQLLECVQYSVCFVTVTERDFDGCWKARKEDI
jgi:hypothetical protein